DCIDAESKRKGGFWATRCYHHHRAVRKHVGNRISERIHGHAKERGAVSQRFLREHGLLLFGCRRPENGERLQHPRRRLFESVDDYQTSKAAVVPWPQAICAGQTCPTSQSNHHFLDSGGASDARVARACSRSVAPENMIDQSSTVFLASSYWRLAISAAKK